MWICGVFGNLVLALLGCLVLRKASNLCHSSNTSGVGVFHNISSTQQLDYYVSTFMFSNRTIVVAHKELLNYFHSFYFAAEVLFMEIGMENPVPSICLLKNGG